MNNLINNKKTSRNPISRNIREIWSTMYYAYTGTGGWAFNHIVTYPLFEMISLGFLTKYLLSEGTNKTVVAFLAFIPIILQSIFVFNLRIAINYQEHLWHNTVVHFYLIPVKVINWLIGGIIYSFTITLGTITVMALYFWLYIDFSVGDILKYLPVIYLSVILLGLSIALFSMAAVITFGHKGGEAMWMTGLVLAIVSGVQYPVSVLPNWLAAVAKLSPMQSLFEGVRRIIYGQDNVLFFLLKSNIVSFVWVVLMVGLCKLALNRFYKEGKISNFIK